MHQRSRDDLEHGIPIRAAETALAACLLPLLTRFGILDQTGPGIDGKAIGYVFLSLIKPAGRYQPELREEGDADMEFGRGVMVESMVVSTSCRTVNFTVKTRGGDSAKDKFRACKAGDGAWEIN